MTFSTPWALLLLLVLPGVIWLGRPEPGRRAGREWASLALRCLLLLLLILGLAGAQVTRSADELAIVYLVDVSDSILLEQRQAALEWVGAAIEALKPNDKAAVILFGADALVERPLSAARELAPVSSTPRPLNTNIAAAIRLGLALLPAGMARRLVLLSDGVETAGDALESAQLAAASGVQIDVYPLGEMRPGSEAMLTTISAPTRLAEGDRFSLSVIANSSGLSQALLRVLSAGVVVHEEKVRLSKGENRLTIPLAAGEPGFARYRVQLIPAEDHFYQNNELAAFSQVVGPPRVLLVGPPPTEDNTDESDQLALALLAAGMAVDRTDPLYLPADLATLSDYATVVLVNVNAKHLGRRKMAALQTAVRDLGIGLLVVGGPESYAPGGYYRTPLEETLPLEMQLKDRERRANLTMIYVIDKSGSMSDTSVGGIPKVELAKEAIIRSLGLLGPMDRAGVVAFDGSAFWVVPIKEVSDPDSMANRVGGLRASGGTDIYAGLLAVSEALPDDPAILKHVILLTDGGASEVGNPELVRQMHDEYGVTLSVVAIGQGYAPWIERLPELGAGRFHFALDPDTIPEIFSQETTLATRSYIIEELFWPQQTQRHLIMSGITAAPPLYGYVGATLKPAAQMVLATHQDDPLLAVWHYGLGKSVAWTSDATGRWAAEWVTWAGFPLFWEQAVKWTIAQERGNNAEVEVSLDAGGSGRALMTVEAAGSDGSYLNGLVIEARVVDPDNKVQVVEMQQVAPGRYRGSFGPEREGAYLIRLAGAGQEEQVAQTAGWVLGYSPEYQVTEPDHHHLAHLAALTGGKVLVEPWESLAHDLSAGRLRRPIWQWLTLAAALLLPLDVALRRLVTSREEVVKAWARVRARVPVRRSRPSLPAPRSKQVGRLFEAKRRAVRPAVPPPQEPVVPDKVIIPTRPELPEPAPPTLSTDSTLAGRLLRSKQKRETRGEK